SSSGAAWTSLALRIAHSGRDVHGERISHSSVRRGRGGYRSEPSGLPGGPGREPGVFSAKSVANMQTDADSCIVQKSRLRVTKVFANSRAPNAPRDWSNCGT